MAAFSIGSWSFHALFETEKMNLFGYLESIKYRYRLSHVDLWNGMMLSTEDDYVQRIKQTLHEEGLTVANLSVDGADVWHADPEVRAQNYRNALRYLNIARDWGVECLRIDMGVQSVDMTEEQLESCARTYREYAEFASDHGFRVGPQTHQPGSQSPRNLERLREAVSSEGFGIVLNVNRWVVDRERGDEVAAPFTMHAQLDRAFVDFHGSELTDKVRLLHQAGYSGCWSLEFRGGQNEYLEVEHDLVTIRRAVRRVTGEQPTMATLQTAERREGRGTLRP